MPHRQRLCRLANPVQSPNYESGHADGELAPRIFDACVGRFPQRFWLEGGLHWEIAAACSLPPPQVWRRDQTRLSFTWDSSCNTRLSPARRLFHRSSTRFGDSRMAEQRRSCCTRCSKSRSLKLGPAESARWIPSTRGFPTCSLRIPITRITRSPLISISSTFAG